MQIAVGGAVASWLVRSTPDQAVWLRDLPLSTQVYKWVPANLMLRVTLRWTSIPWGVAMMGHLGSYANFTLPTTHVFTGYKLEKNRVATGVR